MGLIYIDVLFFFNFKSTSMHKNHELLLSFNLNYHYYFFLIVDVALGYCLKAYLVHPLLLIKY